jgi:baculoviral IAP repeat-containing protein 6
LLELPAHLLVVGVVGVVGVVAGIERLIVVSECSSIFVRVDDDNSFLWRALITGPEETPYSGGAFIFDMFFPPNYPTMPPKVSQGQ